MKTLSIKLTNISKIYTLHHEKPTLVERLIDGGDEKFCALKNINLSVKGGEKIGLIGENGSGKTTLLKIISKITSPTHGNLITAGRIVSLIDLNAGFHPDLTGIQNIFLNGMVLGMRKREIENKLESIIKFADISKFIDVPAYTYSEGMKLRLGFSVAIHTDPDIIILDEGLSVGDLDFQAKCQQYFKDYFGSGKILIVCLHVLDFIKNNCDRILIMKNGKIVVDGPVSLIEKYEKHKV